MYRYAEGERSERIGQRRRHPAGQGVVNYPPTKGQPERGATTSASRSGPSSSAAAIDAAFGGDDDVDEYAREEEGFGGALFGGGGRGSERGVAWSKPQQGREREQRWDCTR